MRALSVLAVLLFHFGVIENAYLGVDIFFVISGYLITGIIWKQLENGSFSIIDFYTRRTRRILPLTLTVVTASLALGVLVMLPDDLENLAQSVVATNFFGNNILQAITTKNYWDIVNDYKPLIHTWSLGVEEQFYLLYPILLVQIKKQTRFSSAIFVLFLLTLASLALLFLPFHQHEKFYFLPFRFFELSAGGLAAILLRGKLIEHKFSAPLVASLIVLLFTNLTPLRTRWLTILCVVISTGILSSSNDKSPFTRTLLKNRIVVSIGLISFSLYMWHQVFLAFTRYFILGRIDSSKIVPISLIILLVSIASYYWVEQPLRSPKKTSTRTLVAILSLLFCVSNISSFYIISRKGVVRDVGPMGISKAEANSDVHRNFNSEVWCLDKPFDQDSGRVRVLVIGNSFARDWVNVLLASSCRDQVEVSYIASPSDHQEFQNRANEAELVFYVIGTIGATLEEKLSTLDLDTSKLFVVGTKNFGESNGLFYNYKGPRYFQQRAQMEAGYSYLNKRLKDRWGTRYIDLLEKVLDEDDTVPVFTPDRMFISQDCRHLTKAGAKFFASLMGNDLQTILKAAKKGGPESVERMNHDG